jgi:hypothetical protein
MLVAASIGVARGCQVMEHYPASHRGFRAGWVESHGIHESTDVTAFEAARTARGLLESPRRRTSSAELERTSLRGADRIARFIC